MRNINSLYDIKGKIVIVTGGRTGIGLQAATAFSEAGCRITIADKESPMKICNVLSKKYKVESFPLELDVTDEKDVKKMITDTVNIFGRLDVLVNNVGGAIISDTLVTDLSDWNKIIKLNINSVFMCCREAGKIMIPQKYGKIINIASIYGFRGIDPRNYIPEEKIEAGKSRESLSFTSSKAAVINLTRDLAVNWAKYNITVNSISPGAFTTETTKKLMDQYCFDRITRRIPMNRWGTNDDLKGAFVFLASDASKYVTGHDLVVDGGWTAWC
jgi:gluconate 5-dehydrogenase